MNIREQAGFTKTRAKEPDQGSGKANKIQETQDHGIASIFAGKRLPATSS
jgi:hypothetical protein